MSEWVYVLVIGVLVGWNVYLTARPHEDTERWESEARWARALLCADGSPLHALTDGTRSQLRTEYARHRAANTNSEAK